MTDARNHLGLALQDFLDDRLDAARQAEIRAHLQDCAQCRGELEALRWVRDNALKRLPDEAVPPGLTGRIGRALDEVDRAARPTAKPAVEPRGTARWKWAGAGVAALLAAAALVLLILHPSRTNLPEDVARDFAAYSGGRLSLDLHSSEPEAVESLFAARGIDFRTRVFDLGIMQYRLVGGRIHRLGDRASALFAYRGPDGRGRDLVCQMYEGRLDALPRPDEVRTQNGIRFQVYRVGELTLVFWQEGEVVCVLASDAEPESVVQLAYAKAVTVS